MSNGPYSSPQDVARAALRLLSSSDYVSHLDLELSAVLLAVHVCDWHAIRTLGHPDTGPEFKEAFGNQFPNWKILLSIANGTKHPKARHPDISAAELRGSKWQDWDFWLAPMDRDTLFIEIDGMSRSVHTLVFSFCNDYLERHPER